MSTAQHLLDQLQTPAQIEALEGDPAAYATRLAHDLGPSAATLADVERIDEALRAALRQLDTAVERVMRIRLDHALATDTSIEAPTRKVFATTIVSYAHRLSLLEDRARDVAARGGARNPDDVAAIVAGAARATLSLRDRLRDDVGVLIHTIVGATVPTAVVHANDKRLDERVRRTWSAARRELEAIRDQPARIETGAYAARLASWPEQLDEPEPEPAPTIADLIELD